VRLHVDLSEVHLPGLLAAVVVAVRDLLLQGVRDLVVAAFVRVEGAVLQILCEEAEVVVVLLPVPQLAGAGEGLRANVLGPELRLPVDDAGTDRVFDWCAASS
jgi:hypothetical protein